MRIVNATPLKLGCFVYRRDPGADRLAVMVKGSFALAQGEAARVLDAEHQAHLSGDEAFDDAASTRYPSDFSPWKPRADVMLVGTCHQPGSAARSVARPSLKVGRMHKAVAVIGERHWVEQLGGYGQSDPKPFRTMPIRYERAYGGEGFGANPVGMGYVAEAPAPGAKLPPLHHIERADQVVKNPLERPAPAGFGPLDRRWAERTQKTGTYDKKWLLERWPCFPLDFDWGYFNAAPADQQIDGYLRGDEGIVCEALHPQHARFEARLPGLRPRAFLRKNGVVEEIALALDTLWIDMDALELRLVWRGSTSVATKRFLEVDAALCVTEVLADPPLPAETYAADSYWGAAADEVEMAAPLVVEPPPEEPPEPDTSKSDEQVIGEVKQILKDGGASAEVLAKIEKVTTVDALVAILKAEGRPANDGAAEADKLADQAMADMPKKLEEHEIDPSAFTDAPEPPEAEVGARLTREEVVARHAASQSLEGVDVAGVDLSALDLERANFSGANLRGARLAGTKLAQANLAEAMLDGASCHGADLTAANLGFAKLTGAELTEARLAGADLTGASMKGAKLARALLDGAVLMEVDLREGDLAGASAIETSFARAVLDGASFAGALLQRADLGGARLTGAKLDKAVLAAADLGGASLRDAILAGVRAEGASFRGADFTNAHLADAALDGAQLTGAVLDRAKLDRASLREASLEGARGEDVSFAAADLSQVRARGASFPRGLFDAVKAASSVWIGARLERARFAEAMLDRADFTDAELGAAVFHRAMLKEARLDFARLQGALLTKVNLFRGRLDSADLTGADCRGSNFFECELLDAVTTKARFDKSVIKRTVLDRGGA